MSLGPVELLVVKFPGNQFKGEIVPALEELVENGTIRVIDLLFARKDADGSVTVIELNDLDDDAFNAYGMLVDDGIGGMLGEDDIDQIAELLEENSSAALLLFENVWATRFRDAVVNANGQLLVNERIPRHIVEQLTAA